MAKGGITAWSCNPAVNGFQTTNDYVIGLGGEQVTEMGVDTAAGSGAATLTWQHTNVWAGGKLLGTYDRQAAAAAGQVARSSPLKNDSDFRESVPRSSRSLR